MDPDIGSLFPLSDNLDELFLVESEDLTDELAENITEFAQDILLSPKEKFTFGKKRHDVFNLGSVAKKKKIDDKTLRELKKKYDFAVQDRSNKKRFWATDGFLKKVKKFDKMAVHRDGEETEIIDTRDIVVLKLSDEDVKKIYKVASFALMMIAEQQRLEAKETNEQRRARAENLRNKKLFLDPKQGSKTDKQRKRIPEFIYNVDSEDIREIDREEEEKSIEAEWDEKIKKKRKDKRSESRRKTAELKRQKLERIKEENRVEDIEKEQGKK